MKAVISFAVAAAMGAGGFAQATAPALRHCLRTQTAFDLLVHSSYAETAPLFGPEGERVWAGKHWNPQFIYPQPAHDEEGAVFTIQHGPRTAAWVNTLFDVEGRHLQYLYFISEIMVTVIDVRFKTIDDTSTRVNVVYTRTALTPEGNEHVTTMTEGDRQAGKEWQVAIDNYLAQRKR